MILILLGKIHHVNRVIVWLYFIMLIFIFHFSYNTHVLVLNYDKNIIKKSRENVS